MSQESTGKSGKFLHEQWDTCSRCGFDYPFSKLVIQRGDRGGVIVCTVSCLDEPSTGDFKDRELPVEPPLDFVEDGA